MNSFASVVLVYTEDGFIPIVSDPNHRGKILWKLPGGTNENTETPEECARREVLEETGIDLNKLHPSELSLLTSEERGAGETQHRFYVFLAPLEVKSFELQILPQGNEGEKTRLASALEVRSAPDFLRGQMRIIKDKLQEIHYMALA